MIFGNSKITKEEETKKLYKWSETLKWEMGTGERPHPVDEPSHSNAKLRMERRRTEEGRTFRKICFVCYVEWWRVGGIRFVRASGFGFTFWASFGEGDREL